MDVTVAVATYGDDSWFELAESRAIPSAIGQAKVVHVHGETLHQARNAAVDLVDTEWLVHLDADDELTPGYIDTLSAADGDVRVPSVSYVVNDRAAKPRMPRVSGHHHECTPDCLTWGNWIVVGAMVRTDLLHITGGWRDFTWSEDWDLWVRCWQAGATIVSVPAAVYRAHVRPDSRNRAPDAATKLEAHRAIARANGLPVP